MAGTHDRIKADQVAGQMETGNLLIALFGDGIAFNGTGTDGIK